MSSAVSNNYSVRVGRDVSVSPMVSVIIPAYNVAHFITETLNSVFIQTFTDFEVIVINDGSPDTEVFEKGLGPFFDNIIYLKTENIGAGAARNIGINNARGEFLAFLDGDDIWLPEFLDSQINFLTGNNYDLVYSDAVLFGGGGSDGRNYMLNAPSSGITDFESLLDLRCNIITSGTVARKSKVKEAGMFEWERVRAHDFVLWLKIARAGGRIGYQRKILLRYRVRPESLTGNSVQNIQREIDVFNRIPDLIKLNEDQNKIVKNQLRRLEAEIELEKGKSYFLQKDFTAARKSLTKCNKYRQSAKLTLIIFGIRIAPTLLLRFFQYWRAEEIAFIPVAED